MLLLALPPALGDVPSCLHVYALACQLLWLRFQGSACPPASSWPPVRDHRRTAAPASSSASRSAAASESAVSAGRHPAGATSLSLNSPPAPAVLYSWAAHASTARRSAAAGSPGRQQQAQRILLRILQATNTRKSTMPATAAGGWQGATTRFRCGWERRRCRPPHTRQGRMGVSDGREASLMHPRAICLVAAGEEPAASTSIANNASYGAWLRLWGAQLYTSSCSCGQLNVAQ